MLVRSITLALTLAFAALPTAAQTPQPQASRAPAGFNLPAVQQQYLDQVLTQWEASSGKIRTFSCDFTRFEYDPVFGPGVNEETNQQRHKTEGSGTVSYQQPDKGSFQVKKLRAWDAANQAYAENPNLIGDHWVCDGKSVFQYRHDQKQLVETPIPPDMQGKNIADGPLPFLFGAKANDLKQRYWLRIDPRAPEGAIWITAMPKRRVDAANYRQVEVMLDSARMLPYAMRVTQPDTSQSTYAFDLPNAKINSRSLSALWSQMFSAPRTPWGWKKVVEPPQTAMNTQPGAAAR